MKKILCICLAAVFLLTLCACVPISSEKDSMGETTTGTSSLPDASPVISLTADKKTVSPGDTVKVTVNISDAPLVACYEVSVFADEKLVYIDAEECDKSEMINDGTYKETENPYFFMSGIILTACDLIDNDMFTITYSVDDNAVSGDELSLTVSSSSFMLATDTSGNEAYEVLGNVTCTGVTLKVE